MKILFFFGTRPEAIKMAPLIAEFRRHPGIFDTRVCVSAQHREMLDQVMRFFLIKPDHDLDVMRPGQGLFEITVSILKGLRPVLDDEKPDWLVVQGDTSTTFVGALSAFYGKVRVCHLEAGLRSFDKYSPFPEEMNRLLTTRLADIHLVPTERARQNLIRESIPDENVHMVGNTVIDALLFAAKKVRRLRPQDFDGVFGGIDFRKRIVLVTGHRRESFGEPLRNICHALREIAAVGGVEIIYPVHLNPNVRRPVFDILSGISNVHLIEPLDYPAFVWLMNRSHLVLTDSGGVQEEAPSLGKPVLVMRDVTERTEGIDAGTARLVGTDKDVIIGETVRLLEKEDEYGRMSRAVNPYGDGRASKRIVKIFRDTAGPGSRRDRGGFS